MILGIQRGDRIRLLLITALLVAVMSGLFVAGAGSWFWWFLSPVAVLIPLGFYLSKEQHGPARIQRRPFQRTTQNGRLAGLVLGFCCSVSLGWLVIHRQPLPVADLGSAALVTVLFSLACIFVTWATLRLPLLSFPLLFLGVTFLFTCSPLILYQTEGHAAFEHWRLVDEESILLALPVVMLAFSSFLIGALLAPLPADRPALPSGPHRLGGAHTETLRLIGFCLYALSIGLIIVATLRGSALTLAYEGGYSDFADARRSGGMSRLVVASLSWFLPWSLLILTATSRTRRMLVQTALLAAPAILIMLLGGARAAPLAVLLLIVAGAHLLGYSIGWRPSLAMFVLVALLMSTTMNLRNTPIRAWTPELILRAATNQMENSRIYERSPLTGLLVANSTSLQTLAGTLLYIPEAEPYRYGQDYVRAIGAAIPFGHTFFSRLGIQLDEGEPSDWLKTRISPTTWAGLGYLQVAEAYLQFGVFGVAALYAVLGLLVTLLWRRMERGTLDSRFFALVLLLMMALLIWVRNESVALTRPLVWGWLIIYVLPALLDSHRSRRMAHHPLSMGQAPRQPVHRPQVHRQPVHRLEVLDKA